MPPHRRGSGGSSPATNGRAAAAAAAAVSNRRAADLLGAMNSLEEDDYHNLKPSPPRPVVTDKYGRRTMGGTGQNGYARAKRPNTGYQNEKDERETKLFINAFTYVRCINLKRRTEQWDRFLYHAERMGPEFVKKCQRFDAVDGQAAFAAERAPWFGKKVALTWDTTKNAMWDKHVEPGMTRTLSPGEVGCALSHVELWYELAVGVAPPPEFAFGTDAETNPHTSMLIMEDDAVFLHPDRGGNLRDCNPDKPLSRVRFRIAFRKAWELLPTDWDIFYLGLSDRGERRGLKESETGLDNVTVELFTPEYGFHTHAYAIKQSAAQVLIDNLPVVGPIDVWLADNNWFGLRVFCAKVSNDGYKNLGANLIDQDRVGESTIPQSGRK